MSFGDISASRGNQRGFGDLNSGDKDGIAVIRSSLAQFQKTCLQLKEKVTEMRRRKVITTEKTQLDNQIKDAKNQDNQLRLHFDNKFKDIDNMPRQDAALQRATVSKLFKDYERLKASLEGIVSEAQLIKVQPGSEAAVESFNRTGNNNNNNKRSAYSQHAHESRQEDSRMNNQQKQQMQTLDTKPLIQIQDIDEVIIAERERDIQKINEDIAMVNDMFERMAAIVQEQGGHVEKIHTATEESHEHAKEGLEQVKQAAQYQPGCAVM